MPIWGKGHLLLNCSMIVYELAVAAAFGLAGELGMGEHKGRLSGWGLRVDEEVEGGQSTLLL